MATGLKYMPVLRVRQEEVKVLRSFDFGDRIYPCLEIYKEKETERSKKGFTEFHTELIKAVKAKKVFVDIPVHMKQYRSMKKHVLAFLRTISADRDERTRLMNEFAPLANKVIPVISTYFGTTGERNSIKLQEADLRKQFKQLAFRIFPDTITRDLPQVNAVATKSDFLIVDVGDGKLGKEEEDFADIYDLLEDFDKCPVIILRSAINKITYVSLTHGKEVPSIDNSLLDIYQDCAGTAFGDYAGIRKDDVTEGGAISPGFLYYDATENTFYGYKGKLKKLEEFKRTIVPAVISSDATIRMQASGKDYLNVHNAGWQLILAIQGGIENGKSMAKFKNISINHYLHCIKRRIDEGEFDQK